MEIQERLRQPYRVNYFAVFFPGSFFTQTTNKSLPRSVNNKKQCLNKWIFWAERRIHLDVLNVNHILWVSSWYFLVLLLTLLWLKSEQYILQWSCQAVTVREETFSVSKLLRQQQWKEWIIQTLQLGRLLKAEWFVLRSTRSHFSVRFKKKWLLIFYKVCRTAQFKADFTSLREGNRVVGKENKRTHWHVDGGK